MYTDTTGVGVQVGDEPGSGSVGSGVVAGADVVAG